MPEIDEQILDVCLGIDEQSDAALGSLVDRFGATEVTRFTRNIKNRFANLRADQLAKLIKVFTRLDLLTTSGFGGGSTSQVYILLGELDGRNPSLANELRIWAFHTTKNPYVPFGTRNSTREKAQSVDEYYQLRYEHQVEIDESERQRSAQANLRKGERAIAHSARMTNHMIENACRNTLVDELARIADPIQRLEKIATDCEHPPFFYPEEFADVDPSALGVLIPSLRLRLAERLTFAPRGKWRNLRHMLELPGT